MKRRKRGFTLLEVTVALAVTVLIMPAIVAAFIVFMTIPAEEGNELTAIHQVRSEADWITLDGMMAREFSPGSSPVYGTFYWEDYTVEPTEHYEVQYRFEDGILMRNETVKHWDGVNEEWIIDRGRVLGIARYMESYSDIKFLGNASTLEVQLNSIRGDQPKELTIQVKSRLIFSEE